MRIAVDAMGGDFAPQQVVAGAVRAATALDAQLTLVGRPQAIAQHLGPSADSIEIRPAGEVVSMDESPRNAIRGKSDSSVARAVEMVAEREAQAVVSAGNSGAFMALCVTQLGTVPGVRRPAIAITVPSPSGYRVLLDAGANVDCKPEHLRDFGLMGSVYAAHALGVENPRVGLLSIGSEAGKGNELTRAAFDLLAATGLNFVGNVEGGQVFTGGCDVVVCDGFVGNAILKACEGILSTFFDQVRNSLRSGPVLRLLAPLLRRPLLGLRRRFDYAEYGGALLLGVNGVCVVSHGCSDATAIMNAIAVAHRAAESELIGHLSGAFAQLEAVS
jgi:glycerol-3-phosphate acyltransferase PlsX